MTARHRAATVIGAALLGWSSPAAAQGTATHYLDPYGFQESNFITGGGSAEMTTVSVGNNTVALVQGTQTVVVEPRGTTRFPNQAQLDMSLRYRSSVGGKNFYPRVDFFNVLNNATITNRVTQLGPTYHRASAIQRGRLIKFGAQIDS
jgi:hypothetical protein